MKKIFFALLCVCLLATVCAAAADDAEGYKVEYIGNNCLSVVPEDDTVYQYGENVTVLFDPVEYMGGIFYGWDMNDDGIADFGYAFNNFKMPKHDVKLKAICISAYTGPSAPDTCYSCPVPPHHHGPFHPGPRPQPRPQPRPEPRPWPVQPDWGHWYPL